MTDENSDLRKRNAYLTEQLNGFDPILAYPAYEGMIPVSANDKAIQTGIILNLITDMSMNVAKADEIARAIRHSMVVIQSEKHNLNYKQSAIDNGIAQLQSKYQGA